MVELSNQYLTVNLHPKGAEIISIVGNQDHINYMWKRDACQWANSAPILFPIKMIHVVLMEKNII